jgi:hypothetical protein
MVENYCTALIVFDVEDFNLPLNTIIDQSTLYRFMVIGHYRFLVRKITISIHDDLAVADTAMEKLQAFTTSCDDQK